MPANPRLTPAVPWVKSAKASVALAIGSGARGMSVEGGTAEDLARLNASFATPRDAVMYIMDALPIIRQRDEEKYDGDYRTKRVILDIYDAMQESIRTGKPYQTRLDPPPADPRCCHPARENAPA